MDAKERFLRYVTYYTTSDDSTGTSPSTERQKDLGRLLMKELDELGLTDIRMDAAGNVLATLPAKDAANAPVLALIAHMDTAPDAPGEHVKPRIVRYEGGELKLNDTVSLTEALCPGISQFIGKELIVTDGTTLLGADDKAGIAEILTAVEEIIREDIPHSDIWIGFTPDEEVGRGADLFNLDYFKADYAYTVDGDYEGEIAYENFNAAAASFKIKGVNVHPGSAKDIMVNAAAVACEIQSLLPEAETPEHTEGREGFFSLMHMSGEIAHAELSYIIRDHDRKRFEERKALLASIADQMNQKYHADTVSLTVTDSYYNMLEVMKDHMYVIEIANEAIKTVGIPLVSTPVRGGTDGARLSYMGLPCPNLGTGGSGFHGPYEHITVEGMEHAVKIIKEIVKHPVEK